MPRRAVLFDYGLTLVSFEFPTACLLQVLERHRRRLGPEKLIPPAGWLMSNVLHPLEAELATFGEDEVDYMSVYERAWRRVGVDAGREVLYRLLDDEQRCWDAAVRLAPTALDTLARLRERGLRLGIASNAPFPPEMMHRQLRGNGIAERVDAIVFSAEVGKRKPAPELYAAGLAALGVQAGDALYVGDRLREDYEGPRAIGMEALLCTALARETPPAGVPSIASLADLVERA